MVRFGWCRERNCWQLKAQQLCQPSWETSSLAFPSPVTMESWHGRWLRSTGLLFQYHFVSGTLYLLLGCLPHFDPSCFLTLGFFVVPGSLMLGSQFCLDLQNSHSIANSVLDPWLNQSLSLVPVYLTLFCNAAVFCVHSCPQPRQRSC